MRIKMSYLVLLLLFNTVNQFSYCQEQLNLDWDSITNKEYKLTLVKVQYDTTSQHAIESKSRSYQVEDDAYFFLEEHVKQIHELISDSTNFSNNSINNFCKSFRFTNAILIIRNDEVRGIINMGCDGKVLVLEPKNKQNEVFLLNQKGIKLKNKIESNFSKLK